MLFPDHVLDSYPLDIVISNSKSSQILKVVGPLRKKLVFFSLLGFEMQRITISKPQNSSFEEEHQFFNLVH